MIFRGVLAGALLAWAVRAAGLAAQSPPPDVTAERAEYQHWLETAPNSPRLALAQQPIGAGLRLGPPDADVPLPGVEQHRVQQRNGVVTLTGAGGSRPMPRGRTVRLGAYTIVAAGAPGRSVLTVFRSEGGAAQGAAYYPYAPGLAFEGPLIPAERAERVRVLTVDGTEAEAIEAGTVSLPIGSTSVRLRVRRIPSPERDESELEIYFRDSTNAAGSYPAGRFVSLIPLAGGRYRLDFNRARNPFCAYSTAYPCPAPWPGNSVPAPVRAGEKYLGGGLEVPSSRTGSR